MPRFGGPKSLSCFYCGKRAGIKFDATITNFLCLHCDATNYLDKNGDITDPPVATEREAPPTQYVTKSSPRPSSPADSVFCETCRKNQRLFTASLAQYLPDDPSHPDYDELDRNYYKYRRNLERRYPQVCDECEAKVQQRIRQAGYTAKTDHLRRMMDRSRGRKVTHKTSSLDWINLLGRWLWRFGLIAQLLWHAVYISQALEHQSDGMYDPDDASLYKTAIDILKNIVAWLPDEDILIRSSITAGILCAWWNPHFVQVNRGFTRHILGLAQWYSFQGLIVFLRVLFRSTASMDSGAAKSQEAQIAMHAVTAAVMCLIYRLASRSIKVDMTPLFKTEENTPIATKHVSPEKRKADDSKTFSELFSEALDSTPTKQPTVGIVNSSPVTELNSPFGNPTPMGLPVSFSEPTLKSPPQNYYADEMDWSPSQPQHRAFQPSSPKRPTTRSSFGESPTQPNGGAFWYKVPPAPTSPAQRHRNPPNKPVLRKNMASSSDVFFSSAMRNNAAGGAAASKDESVDVTFKQPSFFAKPDNDEASSLADLLGQSFTLSQGDSPEKVKPKTSVWTVKTAGQKPTRRRNVELIGLLILLPLWFLTTFVSVPYEEYIQGSILATAGAIALSSTSDGSSDNADEAAPRLSDALLSGLGVVELGGACWLGWEVWTARHDVSTHGTALLGSMVLHQMWKAARA